MATEVLACPKLLRDAEELRYKLNYGRPGAPSFDEPPGYGNNLIDRTRIDYGSFGLVPKLHGGAVQLSIEYTESTSECPGCAASAQV